ncbi:hypothetical protein KHA80_07575 [Anaerobacillus sp. HL2]|nr:hypothetical protein KHA80_07575 [Anaerobacillus sp. HL2]
MNGDGRSRRSCYKYFSEYPRGSVKCGPEQDKIPQEECNHWSTGTVIDMSEMKNTKGCAFQKTYTITTTVDLIKVRKTNYQKNHKEPIKSAKKCFLRQKDHTKSKD